jgi:superfamily I DNA/RNA helicase/RecB family exonuclease
MAVPKKSSLRLTAPELNDRQREAVEHLHGPLLVVAGAGTGKTTVLVHRIARLIRERQATPGEILALTYTDAAAAEMRDRVSDLLGRGAPRLQAKTFHAYCNELLIRRGRAFGVLEDIDLQIYLRGRIRELGLKHFVRAANTAKFLKDLLEFMRRCHDELVGPDRYAGYVRQLESGELPLPRVGKSKDELSDQQVLERCQEISRVFTSVERMLEEDNLGTFGHMITRAYALLESDPALLAQERASARFILVDEFQDANFAQVKVLAHLAGSERNIFAVGDADQGIYHFRGASSAAFGLFQRHFPGSCLVVLEENQRSTPPILRCAFSLIDKNPPVFRSTGNVDVPYRRAELESARVRRAREQGQEVSSPPVEIVTYTDKSCEATDLAMTIVERRRKLRCRWRDFAVLYRNHTHRDEVVRELNLRSIPFSIESLDLSNTPEVRDLLACLGAVVSTQDGASLFRVAALPQFSIDPCQLRTALGAGARDRRPANLAEVLKEVAGGQEVLAAVEQARADIAAQSAKAGKAMRIIASHFGIDPMLPGINAVLEFVDKWEGKAITRTGQIGELVEYLETFYEANGSICLPPRDEDAVRLTTVHQAKGLEFPHVFIIRVGPQTFPGPYRETLVEFPRELRDPGSLEGTLDPRTMHKEEERRLFYVGLTRARDTLTIYGKLTSKQSTLPTSGWLGEFAGNQGLQPSLAWRAARPLQQYLLDLSAAEEQPRPGFVSRVAEWLSLPPGRDLSQRLSATAIESYERCPLQFKLEREWELPRDIGAAMQYGAAMHLVLRAYYDSVRYGRTMSDDQVLSLFHEEFAKAAVTDPYQRDLYEKQGGEQLQDFLSASRRGQPPEVLHTEEKFELRVGDSTVAGRIDRVDSLGDGRVAIVDYKTGKPKSDQDAEGSLQLSVYAMAAKQKWGYETTRLVFYNLEDNTAAVTTREAGDLAQTCVRIEGVAKKIAAGELEAKIGRHCQFCPYRKLCPATETRIFTGVESVGSAASD